MNEEIIWLDKLVITSKQEPTKQDKSESNLNQKDLLILPNEFYPNGLTKEAARNYFIRCKERILSLVANRHLAMELIINREEIIFLYHPAVLTHFCPIILRCGEDFDFFNKGTLVGIYLILPRRTDWFRIDLDPGEGFPFNEIKRIALAICDLLKKELTVKSFLINYTGGRGFHVQGLLFEEDNIDTIRGWLVEILNTGIIKKPDIRRELKIAIKQTAERIEGPGELLIDLSSMREGERLRIPWSLNSRTGLIALPLRLNEVMPFKKEFAKVREFEKFAIVKEEILDMALADIMDELLRKPLEEITAEEINRMIEESVGRGDLFDELSRLISEELGRRGITVAKVEKLSEEKVLPKEPVEKSEEVLPKEIKPEEIKLPEKPIIPEKPKDINEGITPEIENIIQQIIGEVQMKLPDISIAEIKALINRYGWAENVQEYAFTRVMDFLTKEGFKVKTKL